MLINLAIYFAAFVFIWIGSGFIVSSTAKFASRLKLSAFSVSFILLGLMTSIPEFSVGLQAVADNDPEIFVGNLIGGIAVLFLLVIPVLAVFGNGINLKKEIDNKTMFFSLFVILVPSFLIIDKKITNIEGIIMIALYIILAFFIEIRHGIFSKKHSSMLEVKSYSYKDIMKILTGVGLVFISSFLIVDKTLYFANFFNVSAFYISLLLISIGTNLPEMALAIRSVISGKKDVAMGDYMGSAAANTLLFGVFTLLINGEVVTTNNFFITFLFILSGLILFYLFSYRDNIISRKNGLILLVIYAIFIFFEIRG